MNSNSAYLEEVTNYLKWVYGVTDLEVVRGGKHQKCSFYYTGKRFQITLALSPSDPNAAVIKKGDIRRLLGQPPVVNEAPKERRTLAAMTPNIAGETQPKAAVSAVEDLSPADDTVTRYPGSVALYITGKRLRFTVPPEIVAKFVSELSPQGCVVGFTAPDHWTIRHGINDRVPIRKVQGEFLIQCGGAVTWRKLGTFTVTPAEYYERNGAIHVRLLEPPRHGNARQPSPRLTVVAEYPVSPSSTATNDDPDTAAMMRHLLAEVRRLEATTPYRLVKLKRDDGTQAWAWRAPVIE